MRCCRTRSHSYNLLASDCCAAGAEGRYLRFFTYALRARVFGFLRMSVRKALGAGLAQEVFSTLTGVERALYARARILATKLA